MNSNKRLAINMVANIVAFGVQFGVSFFLTPYMINKLGSEAYGFIPLSNNIVSYTNIITIALNSMSSRFIALEMNRNHIEEANKYFNSVLAANTLLSILLAIPSIVFIIFADYILNIPEEILADVQITFSCAFLGMIINLLFNVYGSVYYVRNRMDLNAKRNIEGNIIRAILLVLLFSLLAPHIYYITATMLVVTIYTCIANVYYTKRLTPELVIDKSKCNVKSIKTLLSSGIWNSVNQLSTTLLTTLDLLLANMLIGSSQSGIYSVAKTVPNFIQSIVSVLVSVFVPQFLILYARKEKEELLKSINFSVKIMGLFITLPIGFLIVFGQKFFSIWVPTQNAELLHQLSLLTILPMIITGSINTIFNVYTVTNKLKIPAIVLLITGIVNTVGVVLLINYTKFGIWAIPLVSLVVGVIRNLTFTPIYAAHCLHVKWYTFYLAILRGCCCVITMIVICYIYRTIVVVDDWLSLIIAAIINASLALIINIIFMINKNDRKKLMKMIAEKVQRRIK